jgi:hypothetical protein
MSIESTVENNLTIRLLRSNIRSYAGLLAKLGLYCRTHKTETVTLSSPENGGYGEH